jgi:taurine--2-oxoglutarate transaminase
MAGMSTQEMVDLCKRHTLYTWTVQDTVDPLPVERTDGVYMYTPDGRRFLDFNSQLMSVQIGHNHPKVKDAIKRQLDQVCYVYPGTATEPRARLGKLLSEIVPGDINTFFFTLGGAESNENAVKIARDYTGRHKILSRYRSYHGATHNAMMLTGDPRRWANEPGAPGFVKVMDPRPYDYSFGATDAERTENNLRYLEEVIMYEGPHNIAAMFIEPVTGTNGIMPPPAGYLKGLRELLDRHGILLVCDEVMAGFGRTGRMFAFEHGDIVPDILCMAKGLTSSYAPLGAVGVRDKIAEHFKDKMLWCGLTYNSHAVSLAAGIAAIEVLLEENLVERSRQMGEVMRGHLERLQAKHPSLKEFRQIGLFGMVDVQKNSAGDLIAPYNGTHPAMQELAKFFRAEGLFTFVRWSHFMCNPPLVISEEDMAWAFDVIDRGLDITDRAFEG